MLVMLRSSLELYEKFIENCFISMFSDVTMSIFSFSL